MYFYSIILISIAVLSLVLYLRQVNRRYAFNELNRLKASVAVESAKNREDALSWLKDRIKNGDFLDYLKERSELNKKQQFLEAGLEAEEDKDRFQVIRVACIALGPAIGGITYLYIPAYYATISTIFTTALGLALPYLWLKTKINTRTEDIQRELPLVLDLTNLCTSAGWDVGTSLEKVIENLAQDFPSHPLIKELRRASWLTQTGYTWEEALDNASKKIGGDLVKRTTLALSQAIRQGGERVAQLEAIAEDAQRTYYSALDRRLASLPVKSLLATILLMLGYFIILLAPVAIQMKDVLVR